MAPVNPCVIGSMTYEVTWRSRSSRAAASRSRRAPGGVRPPRHPWDRRRAERPLHLARGLAVGLEEPETGRFHAIGLGGEPAAIALGDGVLEDAGPHHAVERVRRQLGLGPHPAVATDQDVEPARGE